MRLRIYFIWLLLLPLSALGSNQHTRDLAADGVQARAQGIPIMLVFERNDCPYCRLLQEEFLHPMAISGDYGDRVLIRVVAIEDAPLRGFTGHTQSAEALAAQFGIELTPTILFVDDRGRELAPRLVGLGTLDYFGAEIDSHIERARQR